MEGLGAEDVVVADVLLEVRDDGVAGGRVDLDPEEDAARLLAAVVDLVGARDGDVGPASRLIPLLRADEVREDVEDGPREEEALVPGASGVEARRDREATRGPRCLQRSSNSRCQRRLALVSSTGSLRRTWPAHVAICGVRSGR